MVGKMGGRLGATSLFVIVLAAGGMYEQAQLRLVATRAEQEFNLLRKTVLLLSRTSVLENGLRFGGRQVIEQVLDHAILGEPIIEGILVRSKAGDWIKNQYAASGLFVGESETWIHFPDVCTGAQEKSFSDLSYAGKSYWITCAGVEFDDEVLGTVQAVLDPHLLLRRARETSYWKYPLSWEALSEGESWGVVVKAFQGSILLRVPIQFWLPFWMGCAGVASLLFLIVAGYVRRVRLERRRHWDEKEALYRQALQVAHDVRSPVGALLNLHSRLQGLSEEDGNLLRHSIQRVSHIAEDLLRQYRTDTWAPQLAWVAHSVQKTFTELKASESCRRPGLLFEFCPGQKHWAARVPHTFAVLERILVTLLQNAVESADTAHPRVQVGWEMQNDQWLLLVRHNGSLCSPKIVSHRLGGRWLQNILGKNWTAPEAIEVGTQRWIETRLALKQERDTKDFPDVLDFEPNRPIWVLDDDPKVHDLFRQKFSRMHPSLECFSTGVEFERAWRKFSTRSQREAESLEPICFVDFHLAPNELSGPEILSGLSGELRSYLITSMPEDPAVWNASLRWGMPIVPKSILPHLSFRSLVSTKHPGRPQCYLIDDDLLTRQSWSLSARDAQVSLKVFASVEEFFSEAISENSQHAVYVDGGLASAETLGRLREIGFVDLWITTGDPKRAANVASLVHAVRDKTPPWISVPALP